MLVIPAIDLIDGRCVRLHQARYDRQTSYDLDPEKQAVEFETAATILFRASRLRPTPALAPSKSTV